MSDREARISTRERLQTLPVFKVTPLLCNEFEPGYNISSWTFAINSQSLANRKLTAFCKRPLVGRRPPLDDPGRPCYRFRGLDQRRTVRPSPHARPRSNTSSRRRFDKMVSCPSRNCPRFQIVKTLQSS